MIVTVTGTGEVTVPATDSTISFTISSTDQSSSGAVTSVRAKASVMRDYLKSKGIPGDNVAESQVTAIPAGLITAGATGYQATITMAAKTADVTEVPVLISNLYTNGALVVSQPVLSVANADDLDKEALDTAMKDAKNQAAKIGNKNWKFIRKIVAVSQATSGSTSTATTRPDALTEAGSPVAAQNGVFKIAKAVTVSYKMW